MTAARIVTTPYPDTTQRVQLGLSVYSLRIRWSQRGEAWYVDMADSAGNELLRGLRLVTLWPLLYRFHYNPAIPPGELYFIDLREQHAKPTLEGMGDRFRLYYLDDGKW
jgi:hypothetical protein